MGIEFGCDKQGRFPLFVGLDFHGLDMTGMDSPAGA
jgi:hypothetical protein